MKKYLIRRMMTFEEAQRKIESDPHLWSEFRRFSELLLSNSRKDKDLGKKRKEELLARAIEIDHPSQYLLNN